MKIKKILCVVLLVACFNMIIVSANNDNDDRKTVYGFEFNTPDNCEGFDGWKNKIDSITCNGEFLQCKYSGGNRTYMYSKYINFKATDAKKLVLSLRSMESIECRFFFMTSEGSQASEERAFSFDVVGTGKFETYEMDLRQFDWWKDNITQVRIDFGNSQDNTVDIDYFRFLTEEYPSVVITDDNILYDFSINSSKSGWSLNESFSDVSLENGHLLGTINDNNAFMKANGEFSYDGNSISSINIKYQNQTAGTKGKLYFLTDKYSTWNEDCKFEFDIIPNDTKETEYLINTWENFNWIGKIKALKFVPSLECGQISIDYIKLNMLTCDVSVQNEAVIISGTFPKKAGLAIDMQVLEMDRTTDEIQNEDDMNGVILYEDGGIIGIDGKFSFEIPMHKDGLSKHKVCLGIENDERAFGKNFVYVGNSYAQKIKDDINLSKTNKDSTMLNKIIFDECDNLNLNVTEYFKIKDDEVLLSNFNTMILNAPSISTIDEFNKQLYEISILAVIKKTDAENFLLKIEDYDKILDFKAENFYKNFEKISVNGKIQILKDVLSKDFFSFDNFKETFQTSTILNGIKISAGYEIVKSILEENKELLGIDFTSCNKLKNPDEVYLLLAQREFLSIKEVKDAFDKAVSERHRIESEQSTPSGGGSNSSSGGGFVSSGVSVSGDEDIKEPEKLKFDDLESVLWAKESIEELYKKGIINGKSENKFEPNSSITREEFVKMLVLAMNKYDENATTDFSDVPKNHWANSYVGSAVNMGIVNGEGKELFGVNKEITREDVCVMVNRALSYLNKGVEKNSTKLQFNDVENISTYAYESIAILNNLKIVVGTQNNEFLPKNALSRAEGAVVVSRMLNYIK